MGKYCLDNNRGTASALTFKFSVVESGRVSPSPSQDVTYTGNSIVHMHGAYTKDLCSGTPSATI